MTPPQEKNHKKEKHLSPQNTNNPPPAKQHITVIYLKSTNADKCRLILHDSSAVVIA